MVEHLILNYTLPVAELFGVDVDIGEVFDAFEVGGEVGDEAGGDRVGADPVSTNAKIIHVCGIRTILLQYDKINL